MKTETRPVLTIAAILRGEQPADAREAARLLTIHGTRANAMRSRLAVQTDARKAARLRTELGNVETALGMLDTWISVLA